jgi:LRV protein FeS4 cluster/Leucine rich repeat variant
MMIEGPEARDWQGNPVRCAECRHEDLLARGGCKPRWACVNDRYARRIDRFFACNPALAAEYLAHPYFEVCAVASAHANRFYLKGLMDHPDETVRACVARRLPQRLLLKMRNDTEREVRIRVAAALAPARLAVMMNDPDYYVRVIVARRAGQSLLVRMIDDADSEVRLEVARRIDEAKLSLMMGDADGRVRAAVAERLPAGLLSGMRRDADWRVRLEVARRISIELLTEMAADEDEIVAQLVAERLNRGVSDPDCMAFWDRNVLPGVADGRHQS